VQEADEKSFNLDFRPDDYWESIDEVTRRLLGISGQLRRKKARQRLQEPDSDPDFVLWEAEIDGDPATVKIAGSIHPWFMGGEYLPPLKPGEVEIARISLESVLYDVISIRARPAGSRIRYRVVDEYESFIRSYPKSSRRPLTMGQLIDLIDTAEVWKRWTTRKQDRPRLALQHFHTGLVFGVLLLNLSAGTFSPEEFAEEYRTFVHVESEFYPELGEYYQTKIDQFLDWIAEEGTNMCKAGETRFFARLVQKWEQLSNRQYHPSWRMLL